MFHIVDDGREERCGQVQSAPPLPLHTIGHVKKRMQRQENVTRMLKAVICIIVVALRADSPKESAQFLIVETKFSGQTGALKYLV
jgi:hypothetical protein